MLRTSPTLWLYPGGRAESQEDGGSTINDSREGYVAVELSNHSSTSIKIQYCFSVRNANDKEVVYKEPVINELGANGSKFNAWRLKDFALRTTLMELLVQGSLVIEVRMKLTSANKSITQFIPKNPLCKNVLQKFNDEESADVVFEVDNESSQSNEDEHTSKKSKSTTTFYAHRFILQDISTMLAELCKPAQDGGEGVATVSITDVKPKIFKHMIYYAYGGKLSEDELKNNAKDIIDACDKYGVVHLKLEAEACYVKSNEITIDNMMDNLLYADSKNLALLKEAVMDFILVNKHSIIGKVSFDNFPSHLVTDLLTAVARGEQIGGEGEEDDIKYNKMRVGTLRKMLAEKGLDVDGSREAMIALLKENNDSDDSNDDDNAEDNVEP